MQYLDLLLPEENEAELAEAAKALNITPIFLYPFKDKNEIVKKKAQLHKQNIAAYVGAYVMPKSAGDLKKAAKMWLSADFLAVINPGELARLAVSNPRFDAVFRVPFVYGRDSFEYRHSNFNVVLANLAAKDKVSYGLDFSYFLENSGNSLAKLLGREMQNVRLCRRKTRILMASMAQNAWQLRLPENLAAVARVLGLNHGQARDAISSAFQHIIELKEKQRSGKLVRPGVELVD
jgi:RNase P/RNase MRP subunit p30